MQATDVLLRPFRLNVRAMAEALGRRPPASAYSPDMSKHYALGSDPSLRSLNLDYAGDL